MVGQPIEQLLQRHGLGIVEHRRMRIGAVDRLEVGLKRGGIVQQFLPHVHRGKGHVIALKRLAVMPVDAFAQLQRDLLAILGRGPLPLFFCRHFSSSARASHLHITTAGARKTAFLFLPPGLSHAGQDE